MQRPLSDPVASYQETMLCRCMLSQILTAWGVRRPETSCILQVLAPHVAASLDRVYRGASAALRLHEASAPLAALLASWQPPPAPAKPPAGEDTSVV